MAQKILRPLAFQFAPRSAGLVPRLSTRTLNATFVHWSRPVLSDGGGDFRMPNGGRQRGRTVARTSRVARTARAPPPPAGTEVDPWVEVQDKASGRTYWWNQDTDQVTALGEPKPTAGAPAVPEQSQGSGLGRVDAEGFAFGVGSSIARMAIGSVFGDSAADAVMGSDDGGGGDDGAGGGGNEWGDEDQWDEDETL